MFSQENGTPYINLYKTYTFIKKTERKLLTNNKIHGIIISRKGNTECIKKVLYLPILNAFQGLRTHGSFEK